MFRFLVSALILLAPSVEAQTHPRGTPAGTNEHPGPALRTTPTPAWQINPGYRDGGGMLLHSGVLVVGNINDTGGLFGYDPVKGTRLWRIPGQLRGEPASDDKAVYAVNAASSSYQFRLNKIEPRTGKILWSVQDADLGAHDAAPLVAGGRVFITHRRTGLTAYDASSGKLLWDHKETTACSPALAYDGGILYYSGDLDGGKNTLTAVDSATGRALWSLTPKVNYGDGCTKGAAVSQGVLVTRVGRSLFAFDSKTGEPLWKASSHRNGRDWDLSEPTLSGGVVYTSIPSAILGFDLATGAQVFEFASELAEDPMDIRMPVAGGVLYFQGNNEVPRNVGNGRGWIYALDLRSKSILWKYHAGKVSTYDQNGLWVSKYFLPVGGVLYLENASLLAKLVPAAP